MSAPPYMKLYWGDYHRDTRHLSCAQHGAYLLLLGEAWRLQGKLPDDDDALAAWARCTSEEWAQIKPVVVRFFALRRGQWVHDRVRKELAKYESISRQRKSAGKRGGSASRGKHDENPQAIAEQKPTKPEPEPYSRKRQALSASGARATRCPPGWEPDDSVRETAAKVGLRDADVAAELESLRDYEFRTPRSDWNAVARNWLRKAAKSNPPRAGPGQLSFAMQDALMAEAGVQLALAQIRRGGNDGNGGNDHQRNQGVVVALPAPSARAGG